MDINEGNKYIGRLSKARRNRMETNARQWMKQAITEYTLIKKLLSVTAIERRVSQSSIPLPPKSKNHSTVRDKRYI
jgi:hypothetical protein